MGWAALKIAWAFLKRIPWQLWLVLALCASIGLHLYQDAKVRHALSESRKAEVAAVLTKELYKAELDRVLAQLADADKAAKQAIAEKAEAEKAAKKALAQARKDWEKVYGAKPENRAWADAPLPADVERRLRER